MKKPILAGVLAIAFAAPSHAIPLGATTTNLGAALLGGAVALLLGSVLLPLADEPVQRADVTSSQVAGQLFGTWVWPFELLSLLLLIALVAALAVSRIPREPGPPEAAS